MSKRLIALVCSALAVLPSMVVLPASRASAGVPLPAGFVEQIEDAGADLAGISLLDELGDTIPGLGTNPAMVLGLHEPLIKLGALGAGITDTDLLAGAIDALDGEGFEFSNVEAAVDGGVATLTFDLAADRVAAAPLAISTDEVGIAGADLDIHVTMPATTITFEFDPSIGVSADAFAITELPTLSLSATVDETVSEPIQFGFADATAAGTVKLDTTVGVELVDPDASGRLTGSELALLDADDVVALHLGAAGPDDVDIDLALTADVAGTEFGGTLAVSDVSLFADPTAQIEVSPVGANPIDLLSNISPETAITSLTQLVAGLGTAMSAGDVKLPFLADGVFIPGDLGDGDFADFDRVFKVIQPILDYVAPRAAGQIVCGTLVPDAPSPDEDGIPFGSVRNLAAGDVVSCRAYTSEDGGNVQWSVLSGNASLTDTTDIGDSVGKTPTRNVEFTMSADGEFEAKAAFTPAGGDPTDILPRADTIQELGQELFGAGLIPAAGDVAYNADLEAFELPIGTSVPGPIEREITVDAGSSLVAGTGLTGLSAGVGAQATMKIEDIEAGITLGVIATDDEADINPADNGNEVENTPGPGDRFYVRADGPVVSVENVTLNGDISMVGRLGFLEVAAAASGSLSSPGDDPALAVNLPSPTGVTVGANTDPGATLVRDLLNNVSPESILPEVDLVFDGSIAVTAEVPGGSLAGSIGVEWDLADAAPSLDPDVEFENKLFPFEGGKTLTHSGGVNPDETIFTKSDGGLLAMAGLAGSQLVDPDTDAVCNITSVISDTTLRCENPEPDDGDPSTPVDQNPITFADNVDYRVAGNTLAYLVEILDAIDGLADYIETAVGDSAFAEPLPVVGVSPAEIVDQVAKLRKMVDEFRGVQDAQITCTVKDDAAADIRAIAIVAPATDAKLLCHAASSSASVSAVRWRITGDDQDNTWTDAGAGTVGAGDETVELTVKAPGADGFVALGDEYAIEVEWVEGSEAKSAALPPRTPQSLQSLAEQVSAVLGLPDGALEFELEEPNNPSERALRINLGFGICSDPAPSVPNGEDDPCAGMPTEPAPTANLQLDLGDSLPSLVGFETEGDVDVKFAALGQFDIGIPFDGDMPVLYGTTGLEARLEVTGTGIGVTASLGPVSAELGTDAGGKTGTVDEDSASTLVDADGGFTAQNAPVGATIVNTTTGSECVLTALTDGSHLGCALEWSQGDGYRIGGHSGLQAGLSVELDVADGDGALDDDESVAVDAAEVDVTDLDSFLSGDADCGGIDPAADEVVSDGADDDTDLQGIACARMSMALTIGNAEVYVGDLGIDLDAPGLTVFVPNDLGQKLEDALLDPSFIVLAIPGLLKEVETGLRDAADSGVPAAIADPLRTGADGVGVLRQGAEAIAQPLATALAGITDLNQISSIIEQHLTDFLQGALSQNLAKSDVQALEALDPQVAVTLTCGADICDFDTQSLADVTDVQALLTFGDELVAATGVNLGLEGLPLSIEAGVEAFANWSVTVGAGVSREDGPYIALDPDNPEATITAGVQFNDQGPDDCGDEPVANTAEGEYDASRCLRGRLVFLFVTAIDNAADPSGISAELGFNVTGSDADRITLADIVAGDIDVEFTMTGGVDLDLHIRTGIGDGSPDLPSILGTFKIEWEPQLVNGDLTIPDPTVGFDDLHLDLGSFLAGFISPIAKEVKKITGPLQPIIDVLMAPIPVVSDLAEMVGSDPITMISLLEGVSGADLSLVKAVAAFITFFNQIADLGDDALQIPLGGLLPSGQSLVPETQPAREAGKFAVKAAEAANSVSHADAGKLIDTANGYAGGGGFTDDIAGSKPGLGEGTGTTEGRPSTFGVPGLSFPFLDDASQIFGILVGRDATLIRWDAGTLEAKAGFSYDFGPIMVGPVPITITVGGEIGVRGRFAIGYDTSGIRQLLDGGSGVALFDGIFIDDLDVQGNDVPEITFFGKVFVAASVDLVIVSAGVKGGIELTFSLDLDDRPDPDGKLRILEIVEKLQNPICLFVVSGKIEAFLEAFVKIDLFFYTEEFSFELVRLTLLEWSSACEPPTPNLADPDNPADGVLYLNVGQLRDVRNIAEDQTDEQIEVRQIGDDKVRVSGFGWEEVHSNVELIVADAGAGADELLFLPGTEEGSNGSGDEDDRPFEIPVVVSGGPGDDIIKTGDVADKVYGDAGISAGSWAGKDYHALTSEAPGGDDADNVNTGDGDDLVYAGPGNDSVEGQFGKDTILGEAGEDQLKGGPGDDSLDGGLDGDTLQGGPIDQPAAGAQPDDEDGIVGGGGSDTVAAEFGDDVVFGDEAAGFFSDTGDGRLAFTSPSLVDWRGTWCPDTGGGTPADDILTGTDGDDTIVGGGGHDMIDAGAGNDRACGGPGNDEVLGSTGADELRGDADQDILTGAEDDDLVFGGTGNDRATGGLGDDDMFGDAGADVFAGNEGDDVVVGDGGSVADTSIDGVGTSGAIDGTKVQDVDGNTTRDSATSAARRTDCSFNDDATDSDCLYGGSGSDALFGGNDGDFVYGESGVDLLEGNHGPDELRGGTESDLLFGSADTDDIYGDGSADQAFGDRTIAEWVSDTPSSGATDHLFGGPDADRLEGDGGDDEILAGSANDHAEGNDGDDSIFGEGGNDDLIGGSDTAGVADGGETLISGGEGQDVITGDNAVVTAGGYVLGRSVTLLDIAVGGGDTIEGDAATDAAFGEVGDDVMWGDHGTTGPITGAAAADYLEGDDGDDAIRGEAGTDDIVGGNSAGDGVIDADRVGSGLPDGGETLLDGGAARDWIAGDNARMDRVLGNGIDYPDPGVTPILLFDLSKVGAAAAAGSFGGDAVTGGDATDLIFGQGGNDTISGDAASDYVEGGDGDDAIHGGDGDDDLVGGGSANDGLIDQVRDGETLNDGGETLMEGNAGVDWMAGDNAFVNRVLYPADTAPIDLFDVNSAETAVSGGDSMSGGDADDLMFGQGNGAQAGQSDPADGVDNDGDGAADEDAASWLGDTMSGDGGQDYVEGNHGSDFISGGDANDDLIGGGSAIDGLIDADRVGDGLIDARDTVHGDGGDDVVAGDNTRILPAAGGPLWLTDARAVVLFDVNAVDTALSGGDYVSGEDGDDVLFGQGNGAQSADQSDPLDGYDNDLDGRESPASAEYDCADGADNDADTAADGADAECVAATDEDQPWDGDIVVGGTGVDYAEGNHGADWMFGDDGQDDLVGGGSALDGVIDADRSGVGLDDGNDVVQGNAGHDVVTGDNATVDKVLAADMWAGIPGATASYDLLDRTVAMATAPEADGDFGNDHLLGNDGHDQVYGQQGHDLIEGNAGDDGVIGDLGTFTTSVEGGGRLALVQPKNPFIVDHIFAAGTITHLAELFVQQTGEGAEGNDIVLGGQGHDDVHGGPGNDTVNGDLYTPADPTDVDLLLPDLEAMDPDGFVWDDPADPVAQSPLDDEDALFGGFGDDVMWGGRGPDHLYGGHGNDFLDVRPRPATAETGQDPPSWFTWTRLSSGAQESYQDSDVIYGGFGQDALQANLAGNGPQNGDRLFDWVGAYNLFYICASTYGDWVATRLLEPGMTDFFEGLSLGDGLSSPATSGSSGFLELGLVYNKDIKANTNPPHPETPGHFYCGDGLPTP